MVHPHLAFGVCRLELARDKSYTLAFFEAQWSLMGLESTYSGSSITKLTEVDGANTTDSDQVMT